MKMNCMIVDDDPMARRVLENLCARTDRLEVVAICEDAESALKSLRQKKIDLIFLDIQMPGLSGLEFIERLASMPQIIITTAKKEYAFEAFEYQVTDFLKKPIHFPRFIKAIDKASVFQERLQEYETHGKNIFVKEEGRYVRIELDDILYFENVGDYVRIKTTQEAHLIHSTLKSIDEKLNDPRFLKVHRSYIINLNKIKDIQESTLVIEKTVIPISRANKPILMNRIQIL